MNHTAHLSPQELKEAVALYVSRQLGVTVDPRKVSIHMHKAVGNDPREYDYVDASVEYSGK